MIVHKQTGELIDTTTGSEQGKWIFVMSTAKRLYADQKKKGTFHHSSFLAGGATLAAGRFIAENGNLKAIWAYSRHYCPTDENLKTFLSYLGENGINCDEIQILSSSNEEYYEDGKEVQYEKVTEAIPGEMANDASLEQYQDTQEETPQVDVIKGRATKGLYLVVFKAQEEMCPRKQCCKGSIPRRRRVHTSWDINFLQNGRQEPVQESGVLKTIL